MSVSPPSKSFKYQSEFLNERGILNKTCSDFCCSAFNNRFVRFHKATTFVDGLIWNGCSSLAAESIFDVGEMTHNGVDDASNFFASKQQRSLDCLLRGRKITAFARRYVIMWASFSAASVGEPAATPYVVQRKQRVEQARAWPPDFPRLTFPAMLPSVGDTLTQHGHTDFSRTGSCVSDSFFGVRGAFDGPHRSGTHTRCGLTLTWSGARLLLL